MVMCCCGLNAPYDTPLRPSQEGNRTGRRFFGLAHWVPLLRGAGVCSCLVSKGTNAPSRIQRHKQIIQRFRKKRVSKNEIPDLFISYAAGHGHLQYRHGFAALGA